MVAERVTRGYPLDPWGDLWRARADVVEAATEFRRQLENAAHVVGRLELDPANGDARDFLLSECVLGDGRIAVVAERWSHRDTGLHEALGALEDASCPAPCDLCPAPATWVEYDEIDDPAARFPAMAGPERLSCAAHRRRSCGTWCDAHHGGAATTARGEMADGG
jgi:hypothetical protein